MSLLLGTRNSATVRAENAATIRTIFNADRQVTKDPELSLHIATLLAARLERTSALLVEMSKKNPGKSERGLLASIFSALTSSSDSAPEITRKDWFEPN
jgi:CRP/FNR family cyclic AMP-dependent transcriptional regulator